MSCSLPDNDPGLTFTEWWWVRASHCNGRVRLPLGVDKSVVIEVIDDGNITIFYGDVRADGGVNNAHWLPSLLWRHCGS